MVSKILTNPDALSHAHFPEKLLHREQEITDIAKTFGVANTYIYGQTGTGKTTLMQHLIKKYNATQKGKTIYIDCSLYQTTNAIFHELLAALNRIVVSKSNYELTKRLRARLRQIDFQLTICVDHFEHLKEVTAVNKIISLRLNIIIIADSLDSYNRLNPQAQSHVANIIHLPSYSLDQVRDILKDRADKALEKYTYSEDTIEKIIQITQCNIALALVLLQSMALKAESQDKKSLDEVEIHYVRNNPHNKLNQDERILLKILKEWRDLPSSRLYTLYTEQARHPKGERSFRNYMESLCVKGLVKSIGEKRGRVYAIIEQERSDESSARVKRLKNGVHFSSS